MGLLSAGEESVLKVPAAGENAVQESGHPKAPAGGEQPDGKSGASERRISVRPVCLGFLTEDGIEDYAGKVTPVSPEDRIVIAHPLIEATGAIIRSCFSPDSSVSRLSRCSASCM